LFVLEREGNKGGIVEVKAENFLLSFRRAFRRRRPLPSSPPTEKGQKKKEKKERGIR
jgi:hypothetical protein